jgi:hypothetical protein
MASPTVFSTIAGVGVPLTHDQLMFGQQQGIVVGIRVFIVKKQILIVDHAFLNASRDQFFKFSQRAAHEGTLSKMANS